MPAPVAAPGSLTTYEQLEEAGTALHVASIHVTQPVWTEGSGVALADMPDRVKEIQDRLIASGAEVELERSTTLDASGKNETSVLSVVYAHDDNSLPALHKVLDEVANVPAGADYGVRVEDEKRRSAHGHRRKSDGKHPRSRESAGGGVARWHRHGPGADSAARSGGPCGLWKMPARKCRASTCPMVPRQW